MDFEGQFASPREANWGQRANAGLVLARHLLDVERLFNTRRVLFLSVDRGVFPFCFGTFLFWDEQVKKTKG